MSFWENHKNSIYKYGYYYATALGLVTVNYIPQKSTSRLTIIYSWVITSILVIAMPVYILKNFSWVIGGTSDWELVSIVHFTNTLIQYVSVVVTFVANSVNHLELKKITKTRQDIEDDFFVRKHTEHGTPARRFQRLLLFKFGILNFMMLVQILNIVSSCLIGVWNTVHVVSVIYSFALWNITEIMANYFYFINTSALKFYQTFNEQLRQILREVKLLENFRLEGRRRGTISLLCCHLSDKIDHLSIVYHEIFKLTHSSVAIHQFQILGLAVTTLINNLSNWYTLFTHFMDVNHSQDVNAKVIALSTVHAFAYFVDTYFVGHVCEEIHTELQDTGDIMRKFNRVSIMDARLEQSSESLSLQLINTNVRFRICGLFELNRRLFFILAATAFSYFITLVQFQLKDGPRDV